MFVITKKIVTLCRNWAKQLTQINFAYKIAKSMLQFIIHSFRVSEVSLFKS